MSETRWEFIKQIVDEVQWVAETGGNSIRFIASLPEPKRHWSKQEIAPGVQRAPNTSEG